MTVGDRFGDYKVVRQLGKGGMGEVWLLEGEGGTLVAAKILDPSMAADHEARKRFLREAQLALGVKHPNLVETYDIGEDPETGLCYILMEYVGGGTLADYIKENGALAIEDAVAVIEAMASVLELGRQKGIVHRDIKPANIMFTADGTPKLADLGIARNGGADGTETTTVTQTGVMIGTPAYMAPEQMLDAHHVDTRADIYSLGVVFFEMLTGQRPNKDDTIVQLMAKTVKGEPLPDVRTLRPEVSASLAQLLNMMVVPDKEGRISTPGQITNALAIIERGGKFAAKTKTKKPRSSTKLIFWGLALLVVAVGGGVAAFLSMRTDSTTAPVVAERVVERKMATTNVVERQVERRIVAADVAPAKVVQIDQRINRVNHEEKNEPKWDRHVRRAKVGNFEWGYTLMDDCAVIGVCPEGGRPQAALQPSPVGLVEIPAVLDGHPVVAIGTYALTECANVTEVTIPEGVRKIHMHAFRFCPSLRKVTLPESLQVLDESAFYRCDSLESIDLKNCQRFDGWSLRCCSRLASVTVNKDRSDYKIKDGAIYSGDGRRLVFWPRTASVAKVPEGVETIGSGAFQACAVQKVILPKSVRTIESRAFQLCERLVEVVLPEGVEAILRNAFGDCFSLAYLDIPSTVKKLEADVLTGNKHLTCVAFRGNAPKSVSSSVFGDLPNSLEILVLKGSTGWKKEDSTELPSRWPEQAGLNARPIRAVTKEEMNEIVACEAHLAETAALTSQRSNERRARKIDSRVRIASAGGFTWNYTLEDDKAIIWRGENGYNNETRPAVSPAPKGHVTVPSKLDGHPVKAIGSLAFFRCSEMTSLTISEGIERIDGWTFIGCHAVKRIELPRSLRRIESGALSDCDSLTSIDLKDCKDFDGLAFRRNRKLSQVTVSADRKDYKMVDGALYAESGRRLVFWPRTSTEAVIPSGVKVIGRGAFCGSSIQRAILPRSVMIIGESAFESCSRLQEVRIGKGVISVGQGAFERCSELRRIVFPSSLRRMESNVFEGARALRTVVFLGDAPRDVHESVFRKSSEDLSVLVPENSTGWKMNGSTELPIRWPDEKLADSRPIRAVSKQELDKLSVESNVSEEPTVKTARANGYQWKYKTVAGGVEITACLDNKSRPQVAVEPSPTGCLKIPAMLGGKRVVSIGRWAFVACKNLKRVEIPEGVVALHDWGIFFGCSALESVSFPSSLKSISACETFANCRALKSLEFSGEPPRIDTSARMNYEEMIFRAVPMDLVVRAPAAATGWQEKWPANFSTGRRVVREGEAAPRAVQETAIDDDETKDGKGKSRFTVQKIMAMGDSNGWNAMRKAAVQMFPAWRICSSLKKTLPDFVQTGRGKHGLGYRRYNKEFMDVLATCGEGGILETQEQRAIREGSKLKFCVHAQAGTKIFVKNLGARYLINKLVCTCNGTDFQEVVVDLSEYAGFKTRLVLSAEFPRFGYYESIERKMVLWSDIEIE